jgi:hypothetical protein
MSSDPTLEYVPGAFSCRLCGRTFNMEVKLVENVEQKHLDLHLGRFFASLMNNARMKSAFFEFCEREKTLALLMGGVVR